MRTISFATPPSSEPLRSDLRTSGARNTPGRSTPSFEIRGGGREAAATIRWDQINSAAVLKQARRVYFHYVEQCPAGSDPLGIVLTPASRQGRVVFEAPVLLPEEQFVPIDLIRGRGGGRPRSGRGSLRA